LLATAIVLIQNKHGEYVPCRALLDSASQTHCVTEKLVQRLQLPRFKTRTFVQGISAINTDVKHMVSLNLKSRYNDWHSNANCVILPTITGLTPTRLDVSEWRLPSDVQLADESFLEPGKIDLLLGSDIFYDIQRPGRRTRSSNYPVLQETALGWTVAGRTPAIISTQSPKHSFFISTSEVDLDVQLQRFWSLESFDQPVFS
jgi:hypothetical protein